jgi:hypothetical protein
MEEHFCFMYADLCRKITDKWSGPDEDLDDIADESSKKSKKVIDDVEDSGKRAGSLGLDFRYRLLMRYVYKLLKAVTHETEGERFGYEVFYVIALEL